MLCDIFSIVEEAVREYGVPRDMIHVEITESLFVQETEKISREIERFHEAGYQVWMDDFGSGYSSLNVLKDYEFDELKIDMVFLSNFNQKSKEIIASIVRMAKKVGIQTLAEGVETKEQFEVLKGMGVKYIQGFYFDKPVRRAAFEEKYVYK
jgi:EAL domain-containing protein (putative c-di-GMP-specific phosphodiesterase class I)